ncbi:MAG: DUF6791 domain-containing protein [Burkholderiales bacterium]
MEKLPESVDGSIQRLLADGYAIYRRGAYIVAAVPYLDVNGNPQSGLMVDTLNFDEDGKVRVAPTNHQMYFVGQQPYDHNGRILFGGANANVVPLFDGKQSSFYWSWKQLDSAGNKRDYFNLYEKFTEYIAYVSGPVEGKFPDYKITPFDGVATVETTCPFPFEDTNSARANLGELDQLIATDSIVIIGAGGSGSYIFDFISKSRVQKIKLFDFDVFDLNNAFRIPGATDREELGQPKVRVIEQRYSGWHKGSEVFEAKLDGESGAYLDGVTFAFLAVDKIGPRRDMAKLLRAKGIPFIVVGMGIHHGNPGLTGMVDTTLIDEKTAPNVFDEIAGDELVDLPDEYQKNIQTVELNALNAAMAVFMYKKYRGYYATGRSVYQASFTTSSMQLDRESTN